LITLYRQLFEFDFSPVIYQRLYHIQVSTEKSHERHRINIVFLSFDNG